MTPPASLLTMAFGRPRQVAILIDSLTPGGAERVAVEAAGALDRDRYHPHLVVTRQGGGLEQLARDRDVRLTVLGRRRGFAPRKLAHAFSIVRGSAVVHAHLWGSGMWGALLARGARRPLIAHAHRFDAALSRSWLPGYRYWIAPAAHRVVCVSEEIFAAFRAAGLPAARLAVVPNGVALDGALTRFEARAELGLLESDRVIGMVARLREEKRHDLALECLALLRSQGLEVVLCVVGDGPEEARLHRVARDLGVGDHVRWAGPREGAGRLVHAFDVSLITSTIEGMPLAALEALVEGVPIVSTPVGAMPDLLARGGGRVVRAAEAEQLVVALAATLAGSDDAALVRSRESARSLFGIDRVARELEQLYDAAIAGSP